MKRLKSSDPTFNAIQELIYQYRKCQRARAKWSDAPVDLEYFIDWLVAEGWSFDEGQDS